MRTFDRDSDPRAKYCVGARYLLRSNRGDELDLCLRHLHRLLNVDYIVFDCGGVVLGEDRLNLARPLPA